MTQSTMPDAATPADVGTQAPVGSLSAGANADGTAAVLARLDAMSAQLATIAEQVAAQEAAREKWAELVETLVPVSRGAVDLATAELTELSADVTIDDVTRFARTAVKATPQLEALVGQLGSFAELEQLTEQDLRTVHAGRITGNTPMVAPPAAEPR